MSGWLKLHSSWMTSADYLSASAHVGWAMSIVLLAKVAFHTTLAVWLAFGLGMLAAGLKEYVYDANFETPKQTFKDNTVDFLTYLAGGLAGLVPSLFL
jgi:hypothetical protein